MVDTPPLHTRGAVTNTRFYFRIFPNKSGLVEHVKQVKKGKNKYKISNCFLSVIYNILRKTVLAGTGDICLLQIKICDHIGSI